jgi:hypothetical protein
VVHLVRQNLFSLLRFHANGNELRNLVRGPSEPQNPTTLMVDPDHCRLWMTNMARTRKLFTDWLGSSRVFELTYERLTDAGGFAEAVSGIFSEIFGRPPEGEITPGYAKILPPLCRVVENAPQVKEYFAGSEFEDFVNAALASNC